MAINQDIKKIGKTYHLSVPKAQSTFTNSEEINRYKDHCQQNLQIL